MRSWGAHGRCEPARRTEQDTCLLVVAACAQCARTIAHLPRSIALASRAADVRCYSVVVLVAEKVTSALIEQVGRLVRAGSGVVVAAHTDDAGELRLLCAGAFVSRLPVTEALFLARLDVARSVGRPAVAATLADHVLSIGVEEIALTKKEATFVGALHEARERFVRTETLVELCGTTRDGLRQLVRRLRRRLGQERRRLVSKHRCGYGWTDRPSPKFPPDHRLERVAGHVTTGAARYPYGAASPFWTCFRSRPRFEARSQRPVRSRPRA